MVCAVLAEVGKNRRPHSCVPTATRCEVADASWSAANNVPADPFIAAFTAANARPRSTCRLLARSAASPISTAVMPHPMMMHRTRPRPHARDLSAMSFRRPPSPVADQSSGLNLVVGPRKFSSVGSLSIAASKTSHPVSESRPLPLPATSIAAATSAAVSRFLVNM